jgi:predicted phage baseplate assembly protein
MTSCSCTASATCGACAGVVLHTPRPVSNPFGQPALAYRSGRQPDFYGSLLAGLSGTALHTRQPDDATIALLDAFSCLCDVLTFYTERLANESYLRTATDPTSLQELGRLLGYRPNPGAAAQTYVAFTMERPPAFATGTTTDPGVVPPAVPAGVDLAAGLRIMSVPGPGEQPVTFETVDDVAARPEWNSVPVVPTVAYPPKRDGTDLWLAGGSLSLRAGNLLLLAGNRTGQTAYGSPVVDTWDVRTLTGVDAQPAAARTHVTFAPGLGSDTPPRDPAPHPQALVLRTTAGVFGANAPSWNSMSRRFRADYLAQGATDPGEWPNFTTLDSGVVDVEGSRPDLVAGSWIVVDAGDWQELYLITARAELARAEFAISGRVTRLTLAGPSHTAPTPRQVTVYGAGDMLTLTDAPDTSAVPAGTTTVIVAADLSGMRPGRTLIVSGPTVAGPTAAEVVTLVSVTTTGATSQLTLSALTTTYVRSSLVVFGNVARATHGVTVGQILGDGNAATPGQTFAVNSTPITYVQAATASGTASTLQVSVDGVTWAEADTLYPHSGIDRVFVNELDPAGNTNVVFGDGTHGARTTTGSQNIRAKYRQGLGVAGNIAASTLSLPMDRPLGLKAVTNPVAGSGGAEPAGPAVHRRSIPLRVRTLQRAVSVQDYADFALAFTGIAKSEATVVQRPAGQLIVVTVAGDSDTTPGPTALTDLTAALRASGDPHVAVIVVAYASLRFRLGAKLAVSADRTADDVLAAVEAAWRGAFGFDARALGQPVYRSEVIAVAQAVPGVLGVDLTACHLATDPPSLHDRLLAPDVTVDAGGHIRPASLLTLDPAPLEELVRMP